MRLFLLPLLLGFSLNCAASVNANNITEQQYITQLNDIVNNLSSTNSPWPAFEIKANPIIATFANQHNYAYYFSPNNPAWIKISDQPSTYFLDHDEYKIDHIPWSFGEVIDGQTAFIFNLDICGVYNTESLHTLFHERFHIFQTANFPKEIYEWKIYDGFNNIESVKLTLIEDAALIGYFNSHNIEDLKNYAAINQFREKLIGEESSDYEAKKENMEGLADYYGWGVVSGNTNKLNDLIVSIHQSSCKLDNLIACQLQHRYYFTGNVIATALNEFSKDTWKDKLVKDKLSLRTQLFQHFNFSPTEIANRVNNSKIIYHYNEITKPVENAITEYIAQRNKEYSVYLRRSGINLNIEKHCSSFSGTTSDKDYYIDSDNVLVIGKNGVSICQDKSIMVNYFHTSYLLETEHDGRIQLKIAPDTLIKIDGISLTANEFMNSNKDYNFTNLYLKTDEIEIQVINRQGKLTSSDGSVSLIATVPDH